MPPLSEPSTPATDLQHAHPEYSPDERALLLRLAHEAILSRLERRELPKIEYPQPFLELRGAFTTLYLHAKLRGCVGYPGAILPLYRTVTETAQAAAFDDPRFAP